eukprot:1277587-Rhodomonas_salina.2
MRRGGLADTQLDGCDGMPAGQTNSHLRGQRVVHHDHQQQAHRGKQTCRCALRVCSRADATQEHRTGSTLYAGPEGGRPGHDQAARENELRVQQRGRDLRLQGLPRIERLGFDLQLQQGRGGVMESTPRAVHA